MSEPIFHPIDPKSWPMAENFYYYTQIAPTTYTVDLTLDVTALRERLHRERIRFFPAWLYLCTRTVCRQQELRMAVREGVLGYWETLTPVYPVLNPETHVTSLLWTAMRDTFSAFYSDYCSDSSRYTPKGGILTEKGAPPANSYVCSCIPWLPFQSFSLHNHGIKDYYLPSLEAGAFREEGGKITMPLSITVHHAVTEGWHLKCLYEALQEGLSHPETWL